MNQLPWATKSDPCAQADKSYVSDSSFVHAIVALLGFSSLAATPSLVLLFTWYLHADRVFGASCPITLKLDLFQKWNYHLEPNEIQCAHIDDPICFFIWSCHGSTPWLRQFSLLLLVPNYVCALLVLFVLVHAHYVFGCIRRWNQGIAINVACSSLLGPTTARSAKGVFWKW
jgi:hypothetical protein